MTDMAKVIACRDPLMWYAGRLGEEFPIIKVDPNGYALVKAPDGYSNIIATDDWSMTSEIDPTDNLPAYFPNEEKNLRLLIEECSEVTQAICKVQRFGIDDIHPKTQVRNRDELTQEIADMLLCADILMDNKTIDRAKVMQAYTRKAKKLMKWY